MIYELLNFDQGIEKFKDFYLFVYWFWQIVIRRRRWYLGFILENGIEKLFCLQQEEVVSFKDMILF